MAARFVEGSAKGRPHARFTPAFVEYILRQEFTTNARELEAVLWRAMSEATGADLAPPTGLAGESGSAPERPAKVGSRAAVDPSLEQIRAALGEAGGSVEKAARALGLSRFALYRLVKKHGL